MGPRSELLVTGLFLFFVGTILLAYVVEMVVSVRRWWGGAATPPGRFRRWWRRGVLALGTLGAACIVYGWTVEPTWIEVTRLEVPLRRMPAGSPTVRVVHVSDLHVDATPGNEERLPEIVAAEHPDLIVFTGDALNVPQGRDGFVACIARLADIAPVFAVKGNWDVIQHAGVRHLEESRARVLDGDVAEIEVKGVRLVLTGLRYGREWDVPVLLARLPTDRPVLFLHHTPNPILEVADGGVDLMLAGHTHGGQVRLPVYGALLTLARHGKRFESGLYRVKDTWLYVNRGLGLEGGLAPGVRFLCRPEVTVLDLVPAK